MVQGRSVIVLRKLVAFCRSAEGKVRFVKKGVAKGQVVLPPLQFSPVSIIPPLPHTHSFIYHPRCTMFFSSTSVFPCQYHSTIAPYSFIHLPPTLYNVFLPVLQFSPVSIIPPLLHYHSSTTHAVGGRPVHRLSSSCARDGHI